MILTNDKIFKILTRLKKKTVCYKKLGVQTEERNELAPKHYKFFKKKKTKTKLRQIFET